MCLSKELYVHFPTPFLDAVLVKQWDKRCLVQLWAFDTSLWCNFIDYLRAWLQIDHNWFLSIHVQFCVFSYIGECCQCFIICALSINKKRIHPCAHLKACGGSRCVVPLILNLGTAWRSVVNFTTRGRTSTIHWIGEQVGLRASWTGIVPQIFLWINNFYENSLHYLCIFGASFVYMILK